MKGNKIVVLNRPDDGFNNIEKEILKILFQKRKLKIRKKEKKSITFIPKSYPLSSYDHEDGNTKEFLDNSFEKDMYDKLDTTIAIITLFSKLEDKHKLVFSYLLLREFGFKLTHADCAKTLSMSRQAYMQIVKKVRFKSKKILKTLK